MNNNQSLPKVLLPWGISWRTVVLVILTIGTFFAVSNSGNRYPMYNGFSGVAMESSTMAAPPRAPSPMWDSGVSNQDTQVMDRYYPYQVNDVPVTDTREFLKVNYNASMSTRDVQGVMRRVETTVRGYDGRIDQESSSKESGYLSFAVPLSEYDLFRTELEALVPSRFLTVSISSQNLLPQKVTIEEQQKQADENLAQYTTSRQKLVSTHASVIASLQSQINSNNQALSMLRAQSQTAEVVVKMQNLSEETSSLQKRLVNETSSYKVQLATIDANIKNAQDWQKGIQTQDQALLDNVATVSGTISVQWISFWGIAQLYFPGYWIPSIFAAFSALSFFFDRRRLSPVLRN